MSDDPSEELTPGTMLGDYRVESRIGQGGMATVYAAVHPLIGKKAAIKVMSRRLCADPNAVERFVAEARAVNQIGHPNIVDIFTFGSLPDGRRFIVMEWLAGETLQARISRGRLPLGEGIPILLQTADALGAAHEAGIVHRDLKPDNIFLVRVRGGRTLVKLLDFGIAKLQSDDPERMSAAKTKTGLFVGTPTHIAPEQARGRTVGAKTDLYALGVTAFQMATGKLPFDAPDAIDVITMHLHRTPPLPRTLWPEIPPQLEALIIALLAKDPAKRPTLDDMIPTLRSIAEASGVTAELVGEAGGQSGEWPRPRETRPSGPMPILPVLQITDEGLPVQAEAEAMPMPAVAIAGGGAFPSVGMSGEQPLTPLVAQASDAVAPSSPTSMITPPTAPADAQLPSFTSDAIPILVDTNAGQAKPRASSSSSSISSPSLAPPRPRSVVLGVAGAAVVGLVIAGVAIFRPSSTKPEPQPNTPAPETATTKPEPQPIAAPPAATTKPGELTLSINVASQVLVDGKAVADGVRTLSIPVEPGTHELHISAAGYQPATPHVTIDPGGTLRLPVTLERVRRGAGGSAAKSTPPPKTATTTTTTTTATPGKTPGKPGNREYMLDPFGEPR